MWETSYMMTNNDRFSLLGFYCVWCTMRWPTQYRFHASVTRVWTLKTQIFRCQNFYFKVNKHSIIHQTTTLFVILIHKHTQTNLSSHQRYDGRPPLTSFWLYASLSPWVFSCDSFFHHRVSVHKYWTCLIPQIERAPSSDHFREG